MKTLLPWILATASFATAAFFAPSPALAQELPAAPRIQTLTLSGVSVLPERVVRERAEALLLGRAADPELLRQAFEAIAALYKARGYTLAQVISYQVSPDGALSLTIAEGKIRQVTFEGNGRTRQRVLREALSLQEGEVYREDLIQQDRLRLARLGIFSEVLVTGRPPADDAPSDTLGLVDLVVRVKEAQTGNVAATVGYSDITGLVGFLNLTEGNLLGSANQLSVQWQRFGQVVLDDEGQLIQQEPRTAFNVTLQRPAVGRRSLAYGFSVYEQNTVFLPTFGTPVETIRSYERRKGGNLQVGRSLGGIWELALTARRDKVGYDPVPERLRPPTDELSRAQATVAALGFSLRADTRDRQDNPSQGFLHRLRVESANTAFGGDRNFTQATLDLRAYQSLAFSAKPGTVFATRLLTGYTSGSAPLSEQFFLGGFDLLRGYEFFSVRGDRMVLGSAEVRVPLSADTAGVVFVDAGNAWLPGQTLSAGNLKVGGGIGLRFQSPVGPLRLDLALGNRTRTYISVGQSF